MGGSCEAIDLTASEIVEIVYYECKIIEFRTWKRVTNLLLHCLEILRVMPAN